MKKILNALIVFIILILIISYSSISMAVTEKELNNEKNNINNQIEDKKKEIQKVKETAQQESNEFYVLNYAISVYSSYIYNEDSVEQTPLIQYNETGNTYSMSVHDFEENLEPIIMEYGRREPAGELPSYVYDFSKVLKIEPQTTSEYYDIETGEKVVI